MLLTVVFVLLLFLMLYLLFIPIDLVVDTALKQYFVQFKGLAKVQLEGHEQEVFRIKLRTLFMNFYFYPLRKRNPSKKQKLKKGVAKKRNGRTTFSKLIKLVRSFKVKRLLVELDTGDCIHNAKLYPVFGFLNHHAGVFRINFEGRNNLVIHLQNRPINIIKSFINY